jgi:hypothetical protein
VTIDQQQRQIRLSFLGGDELENADIADVGVARDQQLQRRGRARDPQELRLDADLPVQPGAGAGIEI